MRCLKQNDKLVIQAKDYKAIFMPERLLVLLQLTPDFYYGMCLLSAVDTLEQFDNTLGPPRITVTVEKPDRVEVEIQAASSLWEGKTHFYQFMEDRIEYWTEIRGQGVIDRAYYFRGAFQGHEVASVPGFTQLFSPLPNFQEKNEFHVSEYTAISAGGNPRLNQSIRGIALAGAPLCFVFHEGENAPVLSAGILAKPGENLFQDYEVNYLSERTSRTALEPIVGTQAFSLAYHGHLRVNGSWQSPRLMLQWAPKKWEAVERYVRALKSWGGTVPRRAGYEPWTFAPVYCTWHDQWALGIKESGNMNLNVGEPSAAQLTFDACTQANCERWLNRLRSHHLKPGIFIIDAVWQDPCGDPAAAPGKFPDLRGFIDRCHAEDIRVLLWVNGWDRRGIPDDECLSLNGKPFAADPTNPAYRERAARFMRRMLSGEPGCYNADGIKLDGMSETPGGVTLKTHARLAGFELGRAMLDLLYCAGKTVKPDCVIGQYTAFPYFADLCDLARTGDLYTVKGDPVTANRFRAKIQRIVMPDVAIDTDGEFRFNIARPMEEVLAAQAACGIPTIYEAEWLVSMRDFCRPVVRCLDESDYAVIRRAWEAYQAGREKI